MSTSTSEALCAHAGRGWHCAVVLVARGGDVHEACAMRKNACMELCSHYSQGRLLIGPFTFSERLPHLQ